MPFPCSSWLLETRVVATHVFRDIKIKLKNMFLNLVKKYSKRGPNSGKHPFGYTSKGNIFLRNLLPNYVNCEGSTDDFM